MRLVDANVLLYAVNTSSSEHERSRTWLEAALSGGTAVAMAWVPLLAFVRISTRPGIFPRPLSVEQAGDVVQDWLAQPACTVLQPTARHPHLLAELLGGVGVGGNLVSDAHLAALAIEHRAEIVSYDTDFSRFPGVRCSPPPRPGT